jgi:hypothetical protein
MIQSAYGLNVFNSRILATSNPAAGGGKTVTFPTNSRNQLVALQFKLTNDGNVAGRKIMIHGLLDAHVIYVGGDDTAIPASAAVTFVGLPFTRDGLNWSTENRVPFLFNPFVVYGPGDSLNIDVINVQAGDQLSDIYVIYREWP